MIDYRETDYRLLAYQYVSDGEIPTTVLIEYSGLNKTYALRRINKLEADGIWYQMQKRKILKN